MKRVVVTLSIAVTAVLGLPAAASAYVPPTVECFRAPCPTVLRPPVKPPTCERFRWPHWGAVQRTEARPAVHQGRCVRPSGL